MRDQVMDLANWTPPPMQALTPFAMLGQAVAMGSSTETIAGLMALAERYDATMARKAFDRAMADARAEIPPIVKNRVVNFQSNRGVTNYRHEDLAEIARTVDPILARHGLSYRFRTSNPPGEAISVTCILSHRDGHYEENTLSGPRDESGSKNNLQGIGSTQTYLQRYALKAALGLAASNDDDGRAAGAQREPADRGLISDEQVMAIRELLEASNSSELKFCAVMRVGHLADLRAERFDDAVARIKQKMEKAAAQ